MKLPRMTVYSKTLLIFCLTLFLLLSAVILLAKQFILSQFEDIEIHQTGVAAARLPALLAARAQTVAADVREWTARREVRDFLRPSPFRADESGFPSDLLQGADLDFVFVWDAEGDLLFSHYPGVEPSPEDFQPYASRGGEGGRSDASSGVVLIDGRLALASVQSMVSDSESGNGETAGSIFGGRRLDGGDFVAMRDLLGGTVAFQTIRDASATEGGRSKLRDLLVGEGPVVETPDAETIIGSAFVRAMNGDILGVMNVTSNRVLYREGLRAISVFLVGLAVAGGGLVFITWFLLDRHVLARIRDLETKVVNAKLSGELPAKLYFEGDDELASLASSIEALANSLQRAQENYRDVVMDQTELIARFGPDLEIQFANSACARFLGDGDGSGRSILDIAHPSHRKCLESAVRRLTPSEGVGSLLLRGAGGVDSRWFQSTIRGRFDSAGAFAGGQLVAFDVTEQRKAEQELAASEREMRSLSSRLLRLQDEERRRIARELHDSTAQNLSALEMNVSLLEKQLPGADVQTRRLLRETREIAAGCSREIRTMSYLLHPPLLDEVGLLFALRWYCDGFQNRSNIAVKVSLSDDLERLPGDVEMTLFRVAQEGLTNIYRHAEADAAWISLSFRDDVLGLEIRDRGCGFDVRAMERGDVGAVAPGVGLAGMRERMRQIGGTLEIQSDSSGTIVRARITEPFRHRHETA